MKNNANYSSLQVPNKFVRPKTIPPLGRAEVYTSEAKLSLPTRDLWDEQGRLVLRCSADIFDLFHEEEVLELHNPALRRARLSGLFAAGECRQEEGRGRDIRNAGKEIRNGMQADRERRSRRTIITQ